MRKLYFTESETRMGIFLENKEKHVPYGTKNSGKIKNFVKFHKCQDSRTHSLNSFDWL